MHTGSGRVALLLAGLLACGCATRGRPADEDAARGPFLGSSGRGPVEPTVVAYRDYRDPLIRLNRGVFAFNDVSYRYVFIPLSKGYRRVVPDAARKSVGRFFYNVQSPVYLVNNLLQLKPKAAGRTLARFLVNSTAGVGGLFDPARAWLGYEREEARFGETLARYRVGYGIYLVVPLLGPSDLRSGAGLVADFFLNPIPYLLGNPESSLVSSFDTFQEFAPQAERYETLRRESEDPYIFFRNLHLQGVQRDADY